ncbi:MAG: hypothetical protein AAF664_03335, partial [Planctomycetota bacterium]
VKRCNLKSIASLDGLDSFSVDFAGVSRDNLRQMSAAEGLRYLSTPDLKIDEDDITWAMESFPNLKRWYFIGGNPNEFTLTEPTRLEDIGNLRIGETSRLRLIDQPRLSISLFLDKNPDVFEISGVPNLISLQVRSPWRQSNELDRVRGLVDFEAGGPEITDEICDELALCPNLKQFSAYYGSLSARSIKTLAAFNKLTMLAIPGCELNEEATKSLEKLSLQHANFADCKLHPSVIDRLAEMPFLSSVVLDRSMDDKECWQAIRKLETVRAISLRDCDLDEEALISLLQLSELEYLDLAGCEISASLNEALLDCTSLLRVNFEDATLPEGASMLWVPWSEQLDRWVLGLEVEGLNRRGRSRNESRKQRALARLGATEGQAGYAIEPAAREYLESPDRRALAWYWYNGEDWRDFLQDGMTPQLDFNQFRPESISVRLGNGTEASMAETKPNELSAAVN